jgi:hypothetical protein
MIMMAAVLLSITAVAQSLEEGMKMYNYKKYQSAKAILEPLAAGNAMANYYLGLSYLELGDVAAANAAFSKYPEDQANMSGMARVAFANKNAASGMQLAKNLAAKAKKKDWQPQKYAADAVTYSEGGDYNQAIAWYKDALAKNPDEISVRIGLGDAYRKVPGGGGEAMTSYESVTEKNANNSLAYSRIGDLWYEARNYQSALDNYAKAKDADNTNPLPYKALADAYSRSGKYKLSLENIQKYIELSDKTMDDQIAYVRTLYLAQSYCDAAKKAQEMLNGGQVKGAMIIEMYGVLGFSQADCGDSVEALKNLRTYFQMQTPAQITPGAYIQFGKLFLKLDMIDSAAYYYTKGIAGDTTRNKTDIYRDIAEAFKAKKEYCKSAEWYDNLIKANPETQPQDYAYRAIWYYYCKEFGKSLSAATEFANKYGQGNEKYPAQPSSYYWQGRAAAAIDSEASTGNAVPYFTKWLEVVGPNYDKKNDLKMAYQYMMYYYYNKKDKENLKVYMDKVRSIDPKDRGLLDIEEAEKAPAKKPAAPPKK